MVLLMVYWAKKKKICKTKISYLVLVFIDFFSMQISIENAYLNFEYWFPVYKQN